MRKLLVPSLIVLAAVNLRADEPGRGTDHTMTSAAYSRVIDGRTEPEKIPDQVRYGMFVKRYLIDIRENLIHDLPPGDDAILHGLAVEDEQKSNAELRQYQESMRQFCQSRTIRDAVSLARENKRIVDEFYAAAVRRYLASFDSLSPVGRKIVDSFIETTVVPNTQASVLDGVEWAKQHPEEYLHDLEIACHVAETGQLPAWLEMELDRRLQQDIPDAREIHEQRYFRDCYGAPARIAVDGLARSYRININGSDMLYQTEAVVNGVIVPQFCPGSGAISAGPG